MLAEDLNTREPNGSYLIIAVGDVIDELIRCVAGWEWPPGRSEMKTVEMYEPDGTPTRETPAIPQQEAWEEQQPRAKCVAFSADVLVRTYVVQQPDIFDVLAREEDAAHIAYLDDMYGADSDDDDGL